MSRKKSLLLIEPYTVFPLISGGKTRILNTIIELQKYFNLSVWSIAANKQEELLEQRWFKKINIFFKHYKIKTKQIFSFLLNGQPYWFSDFFHSELILDLKKISQNFSIIQVEFSQLLYLIDYLPESTKKIFVAYDISTISFWRRFRSEKNIFKKILHLFRFLEIYLYERKYLPKYDEVIAVSSHDAKILKEYFKLKRVKVIPNAIQAIHFLPFNKKGNYFTIGYIGSFNHAPNLEAFKFLLNKVLPELEKGGIKYQFFLAGNNCPDAVNSLLQNSLIKDKLSIIQLGYVKKIESFYQKIDLLVAPIFAGSGTRIKILESLSYGRPILTTIIGAEGININSPYLKILSKKSEKKPRVWAEEIVNMKNNSYELLKATDELKLKMSRLTWKKIFSQYKS